MRYLRTLATLLVVFVVPAAFAADSSHGLTLTKEVAVNGTALRSGNYKVKWAGTGDHVDVSITQGKHVVATSPARVVALEKAPSDDTLVYRQNSDGTLSLSEIRFGGKKFALSLGEQTASMSSSQGSSTTTNK